MHWTRNIIRGSNQCMRWEVGPEDPAGLGAMWLILSSEPQEIAIPGATPPSAGQKWYYWRTWSTHNDRLVFQIWCGLMTHYISISKDILLDCARTRRRVRVAYVLCAICGKIYPANKPVWSWIVVNECLNKCTVYMDACHHFCHIWKAMVVMEHKAIF